MKIALPLRARQWALLAAGLMLVALAAQLVKPQPAASAQADRVAAGGTGTGAPLTGHDLRHDLSPPLGSIPPITPRPGSGKLADRDDLERITSTNPRVKDPVV